MDIKKLDGSDIKEVKNKFLGRITRKNTLVSYTRAINFYIDTFKISCVDDIEGLALGYYDDFAKEMLKTYKPSTVKLTLAVIGSFLSFLKVYGLLDNLVNLSSIKLPEEKNKVVSIISSEDLKSLLGTGVEKQQDRLLVRLLYYTGRRVGDIARIRIKDILVNPDGSGILKIKAEQKTGKKSKTFIPKGVMAELELYVSIEKNRMKQEISDSHYLFGAYGKISKKKPQAQNIRNRVNAICRKVNVNSKKISPHTFRHTVITKVINEKGMTAATQFANSSSERILTKFYWNRDLDKDPVNVGKSIFGNV